MKTKIFKKK